MNTSCRAAQPGDENGRSSAGAYSRSVQFRRVRLSNSYSVSSLNSCFSKECKIEPAGRNYEDEIEDLTGLGTGSRSRPNKPTGTTLEPVPGQYGAGAMIAAAVYSDLRTRTRAKNASGLICPAVIDPSITRV